MTQMPAQLTKEEREQILQTIEMFEVIVQASPNDLQSLAILKDAYLRVGQMRGAGEVSCKLAEIYVSARQFLAAVQEYESILEREPGNVEVIAALGELNEKMQEAGQEGMEMQEEGAIDLDFQVAAFGNSLLTATVQTRTGGLRPASAAKVEAITKSLAEDGNEAFAKFLIQYRIIPEDVVRGALDRVLKKDKDLAPGTMAHSFLDEAVRRGGLDLETTLCAIVDRSKFAYIPLEYYEVDRQILKMLPDSLTLGRLIVPFDVMSRTLMIALANPFDAVGKDAVQQLLDFNIQWHIASPTAVMKVLSETYRVAGPGIIGMGAEAAAFN